ncbi:enoyl-CoA hydratase/isomerase family protein [Natrinema sp. 1APR25-10V2]|uniref:enoyl-CoA hydratase/isomerase family protein n=1 Tax=Natrinema sp. 1APR25-10V2 TaxID=2951081 RepID=UPI00287458C0|nr:enoyl-CoA hydratase/isomerase family protein [Natrinema sp. 1APR25-10V2]MDS0476973.1 enoyl-CoA hydratase/isomerase family protein [Natrinema sp. 1APR25-10V2]
MSFDPTSLSNEDLTVTVSDDEVVVRATIDRPDKHNALNDQVLDGLINVMDAADESPARVIVIRGAEGTFCSGGDLEGMDKAEEPSMQDRRRSSSKLSELFDHMVATSALTVAAVEGYCLAGGCGLAAACEFVVAADNAEFGTPEVNVGMFPMQAMASIMPAVLEKQGLKMLFTGEHVSAEEGVEIGLVTEVFDSKAFDDRLDEFVDTLAANSPVMISMGKEAYYNQRDMAFDEAYNYLKEMLVLLMESEDHKEGVAAFVEDREPDWKSR